MMAAPDEVVERVAEALDRFRKDHRCGASGSLQKSGYYRVSCSCGEWSTEVEGDLQRQQRTGLTTVTGGGMWDRAAREHYRDHFRPGQARAAVAAMEAV